MKTPAAMVRERMLLNDAETRSTHWLAEGNEAMDQAHGADQKTRERLIRKALKCYDKSQYWLDIANKIRGLD